MKKYLMTGITALALCAGFTSCSHDLTPLTDEEKDALEIKKIQNTYNQAFIATFGKPAKNQDWGFTASRTRGVNANANEWAASDGERWKVPPRLTDQQKAVVTKYFQTVQRPEYEDPQWTDYFIQQVYKGGTTPLEGYSPEKYTAADGITKIVGSDNMDHLAAIDGDLVDHNYNFNHGDYPDAYPNVLDYTAEQQYTKNENSAHHHSDQIELMVNSTTKSFGYFNSAGSVRRTEYTGLVSAATIIAALGDEANCLNDGWNRSFMGFDFELMIDEEMYATGDDAYATYDGPATDGRIWDGTNVITTFTGYDAENGWAPIWVEGYEHMTYNGEAVRNLSSDQNNYAGDFIEYTSDDDITINIEGYGKCLNMKKINDDLLSQGYLPVAGGKLKKWVKVGGTADGYYSDWIVTLTKAEHYDTVTPPTPPSTFDADLRIMAEDLSATEASDFDFNDVVFDVKYGAANEAQILVRAAGGTLPLRIKIGGTAADRSDWVWQEVHALWGQPTSIMINTNATSRVSPSKGYEANYDLEPITLTYPVADAYAAKGIIIEVQKTVNGVDTWIEMEANQGEPASKFACSPNITWAEERVSLKGESNFADWVTGAASNWTWY